MDDSTNSPPMSSPIKPNLFIDRKMGERNDIALVRVKCSAYDVISSMLLKTVSRNIHNGNSVLNGACTAVFSENARHSAESMEVGKNLISMLRKVRRNFNNCKKSF